MDAELSRIADIFIIDDDIDNLNVLIDFLDKSNYRTFVATNGYDAIEQISYKKPDLILMDVMMPGIDGFETCCRIKEKDEFKEIPVIFMTALSETVNKLKGFEVGGSDYITKPFQIEEVLARINAHLTIKNLQIQLKKKNEELEALNASKDKFFSILAHDLKNPMVVFLSYSQILDKIENMEPEKLKIFTKQFHESARNLVALLENLLTWSRIQRGMIDCSPAHINVNNIISWNIKLLAPNAEQKKITIKNNILNESLVFADENMLNTIVRNLLSNAIKFTDNNGTVEIDCKLTDNSAEISVSDTGIGIPEEILPNLFHIDVRSQQAGTAGEKGTGLGLILCKEFIDKHDGKISVESNAGKGTKVTFTLPNRKDPE